MKECTNCERLKQRVAELNSELLVLKIAALAAGKDSAAMPPARKTRTAPERRRGDQPRAS
ncbi:MAG: hypothetical protein ACJ71N_06385 [Terriglobales bacterium]|jgi:hypothetical protein